MSDRSKGPPPYEQVIRLSGRNALRTAALGLLVWTMGGVVAWLVGPEPWPILFATAFVVVPVVALGTFILVMAAVFHVRRATWRLRVDAESVALDMQAANGRSMKRESLRTEDLVAMVWIEGDADVSAGIRLRAGSGTSLFVPPDAFDVQAAWDALVQRLPHLPTQGR